MTNEEILATAVSKIPASMPNARALARNASKMAETGLALGYAPERIVDDIVRAVASGVVKNAVKNYKLVRVEAKGYTKMTLVPR